MGMLGTGKIDSMGHLSTSWEDRGAMMSTCANVCGMPKRVTVILSDDEYAHIRTLAGLVPLSAWFRSMIPRREELTTVEGVSARSKDAYDAKHRLPKAAAPQKSISVEPPPTQCEHKKHLGELCYKCDPKMGYPVISDLA